MGGVRVAAFATWPGRIQAGSVVNEPLHIVDWYPTLLKLAGASLDQKLPLDGRDAWPTIARGKPSPHEEIVFNSAPASGAILVGQWKLVIRGNVATAENQGPSVKPHGKQGKGKKGKARQNAEPVELFNLANDPYEKDNLAKSEPEKLRQLTERYKAIAAEAAPPRSAPKAKDFRSPKVWGETE